MPSSVMALMLPVLPLKATSSPTQTWRSNLCTRPPSWEQMHGRVEQRREARWTWATGGGG
eukprot:7267030-Pyramimonas_sp.AAC.2